MRSSGAAGRESCSVEVPPLGTLLQPPAPPRNTCSDLDEKHRRLAEITEMIHTASLVHDDVLDESSLRRGAGGVWRGGHCGRLELLFM